MAAKAVALKLNGKPFQFDTSSPVTRRVVELLSRAGDDDLFTPDELAGRLKVRRMSIYANQPELKPYTLRVGKNRYFGSPAAIKELQRLTGGAQ